jgi:hypothetical protein
MQLTAFNSAGLNIRGMTKMRNTAINVKMNGKAKAMLFTMFTVHSTAKHRSWISVNKCMRHMET